MQKWQNQALPNTFDRDLISDPGEESATGIRGVSRASAGDFSNTPFRCQMLLGVDDAWWVGGKECCAMSGWNSISFSAVKKTARTDFRNCSYVVGSWKLFIFPRSLISTFESQSVMTFHDIWTTGGGSNGRRPSSCDMRIIWVVFKK